MSTTVCLAVLFLVDMCTINVAASSSLSSNASTTPKISVQNESKLANLNLTQNDSPITTISPNSSSSTAFPFAQMLKNSTTDGGDLDDSEAWEESHSEEFLETINNGTLTRGAKVQEVKTQWSTNFGDDEAEATE